MTDFRQDELHDDDVIGTRKALCDLANGLVEQIQSSGNLLTLKEEERKVCLQQSHLRHVQVPWTGDPYFDMRFRPQDTRHWLTIGQAAVTCKMHIGAYTNTDGITSRWLPVNDFSFKNLTLQGLAHVIRQLVKVSDQLGAACGPI